MKRTNISAQNKNTYKLYLLFFSFLWMCQAAQAQFRPEEQLGELFEAVQMQAVFPDSKTFADCAPRTSPEKILQAYRQQKTQANFNLKAFVLQHFTLPPDMASDFSSDTSRAVTQHIQQLWPVLTRQPGSDNSSLLPLPNPYVVPGGRFREIYYWDSYFTMLGLQQSGETELIRHMIDNFTHLINTVGHIPNGNRSYYISRSQPPFYALMVGLLAQEEGQQVYSTYGPALRKEYEFWMEGADKLSAAAPAHQRVVRLPDGSILNRYWDDKPTPRPESYKEDVLLVKESGRNPEELYRELKAAAESGWDFSTRWFADGQNLHSIHTTDIIPVDLNALLYHLELSLVQVARVSNKPEEARQYEQRAIARRKAMLKYCWSTSDNFFYDYDFKKAATTNTPTLAAAFPLYFNMATRQQATAVAHRLERDFLKSGGLVTTLTRSGEQWDAPNGWAPLQWIGIQGLRNYNHHTLAATVASNWISLNTEVYKQTGKMMEKYNVQDLSLIAGGGEYPLQDGFGWTNGVLLKLLSIYPDLAPVQKRAKQLQKQ